MNIGKGLSRPPLIFVVVMLILLLWIFKNVVYGQDITTGLQAHYKFDEGIGSVLYDSVNAYNLNLVAGSPSWTKPIAPGQYSLRLNSSTWFSGAEDDFGIPETQEYTVSWWVHDSLNLSGSIYLSIEPYIYPFAARSTNGRLTWIHRQGNATHYWNMAGAYGGADYHIAITYSSDTLVQYINGVVAESRSNFQAGSLGTNGDQTFRLGNWPGRIDELRIYNRALTPDDILAVYNAPVVVYANPPNLPNPPNPSKMIYIRIVK